MRRFPSPTEKEKEGSARLKKGVQNSRASQRHHLSCAARLTAARASELVPLVGAASSDEEDSSQP